MAPKRSLFVLASVAVLQNGCANTLEAVGGTAMVVGAGTVAVGAQLPSGYDCTSSASRERAWCTYGDAHGNAPTNGRAEVPVMIAGAAIVAAGAVVYIVGRTQRPPAPAGSQPPPPARHESSPADDPEETLLRE